MYAKLINNLETLKIDNISTYIKDYLNIAVENKFIRSIHTPY